MIHHNVDRADIVRKSAWKVTGITQYEEAPFYYTHEVLVSTATQADLPPPTLWLDWVNAHPNVNTSDK